MNYDRRTSAVKLKPIPSSKQEPMWKTVDGRFLVMTFRSYSNRDGKKRYSLTYMVTERDGRKEKTDLGEARNLKGAKRLIEDFLGKRTAGTYSYDRRAIVSIETAPSGV